MKVINEKTENRQAFLTIEVETDEMEKALDESYHRLANRTNIPGFRKGKAPRLVLERYIGKERLVEDALNSLLPEAYKQALKEQNIEAYAQPHIDITQTDPVIFKMVVPLAPTIELGDYHSIKVVPETVTVTEDDVNTVMNQLQHQQATWEPSESTVDLNDLVTLDIESNVDDKPYVNQKGAQCQVIRELPLPAPGFAEQLVGMKRDEEKEFKLQFPEDSPKEELAGKEPSFKVKITEVKHEKLPELNDEFAKEFNPDFENLEALQRKVSADLKYRAEEKARLNFEDKVIEAAVGTTELEFPPVLVEIETNRLINQQLRRFQVGTGGLETYLKSINKTEEELRQEINPVATKRVAQSLTLDKIAKEEKFEVSDAEINTEIENTLKSATENKDELSKFLNTPEAHQSIEQALITQKTVRYLVEMAKGLEENTKTEKEE